MAGPMIEAHWAFMPSELGRERLATVGEYERPRDRTIEAGNTISLCGDEVVRGGERATFAQLPQQHARPIFDLVEPRTMPGTSWKTI